MLIIQIYNSWKQTITIQQPLSVEFIYNLIKLNFYVSAVNFDVVYCTISNIDSLTQGDQLNKTNYSQFIREACRHTARVVLEIIMCPMGSFSHL